MRDSRRSPPSNGLDSSGLSHAAYGLEDGGSLGGEGIHALRFDPTIDVASLEAAASKWGLPLKVLDIDRIDRPDTASSCGGRLTLSRPTST